MSQVTPTASSRSPVRCLVIQLTKLGDTLQSLMALRAAKQLYPQLEITFVARDRFADAAKRVPWLDRVITLPTDEILGPMAQGLGAPDEALRKIAAWTAPLVDRPWDLVVNWSYSESSSYLTGLVPAKVKLGFSRITDKGPSTTPTRARSTSLSALDGWSHYIQAIVQGGVHQNIHLTDVLTTQLLTALQIHVGDPEDNGDAPVTSKNFFALDLGPETETALGSRWRDRSKKWIAIQLGAGQASKTWAAPQWSGLIRRVLDDHPEYGIVLLGGGPSSNGPQDDLERSKKVIELVAPNAQEASMILPLVGRTDFDLWANVVSRCQWLFASDTAAIHLASVLGTRVMNVSVGPVRAAETGPYGNGHYVISSNLACPGCDQPGSGAEHECRTHVTSDAVYGAWSYALRDPSFRTAVSLEQHFAKMGLGDLIPTIRVARSRIRSTADGGGVVYEAITPHPIRLGDWTAMVMGHIARSWYCGWVPPVGKELSRSLMSPPLLQKLRELEESAMVLAKICDEANRTAVTLNRRSSRLRSDKIMNLRDRDELREIGKKLMDLDALVERMGKAQPTLQAFSQMSKVLMHNLRGEQLSELGRETAECYRQLSEGVTILRDWIRHSQALARPVAIKTERLALIEA